MAGAVAYNAFFALVPAGFALMAAASFIGLSDAALDRTTETLERYAPQEVTSFIVDLLEDTGELASGSQGWIIAVGLLVALWSGSRGVVALQKALARIENMDEDRTVLERRLVGIGLTVGSGLVLAVVSASLVAGRRVVAIATEFTGFSVLDNLWALLRFPLGAGGLFLFLLAVYRWGPPRPLPGSWLAAIVASVGTLGATFGILGTVAFILLWLYIGAYVILLGAGTVAHFFRSRLPKA